MATGLTTHGRTTPGLLMTPNPNAQEGELTNPEEDEEAILEGEELFMTLTPEEQAEWERMMAAMSTNLKERKERFKSWIDRFTRRRMFALSRARKLQETFKKRTAFYADLGEYITTMEAKVKVKDEQENGDAQKVNNTDSNEGQKPKDTEGQETKDGEGQDVNKVKVSEGQKVNGQSPTSEDASRKQQQDNQKQQQQSDIEGLNAGSNGKTVLVQPM